MAGAIFRACARQVLAAGSRGNSKVVKYTSEQNLCSHVAHNTHPSVRPPLLLSAVLGKVGAAFKSMDDQTYDHFLV